ncbi:MAG: DUF2771 domain-containing protein [Mycobacterium sp.]|nr:DUF2771 domain-containing protein [Mycobacterium sp.]
MKRLTAGLLAVLVLFASAAAGVGAWRLARTPGPHLPQISVYALGHTIRVNPFLYCNVVDLNDCARTGGQGVLMVDESVPVQLSVPTDIGRAPWRLLKVYADPRDSTETVFRPGARLAVTIPTVDEYRGRLMGIVVQLMTLVRDQDGELFDLPHAEWSVRLDWA